MYTSPLGKNKFIIKENTHNFMSFCFFAIMTTLSFSGLLFVSIKHYNLLIASLSLIFVLSLLKLVMQIRWIFMFVKLVKKVDEKRILFYILKSWNRKKEANFWFMLSALFINVIFIIFSLSFMDYFSKKETFINIIFLPTFFLFLFLSGYTNNFILDDYWKLANKKMNTKTIEWIQIKKEQRIFYKNIFFWFVSIILVFPLLLMIFPFYRKFIKKNIY